MYLKWKAEALNSPVIIKRDGRWGGLIIGAPALTGIQNRIIKDGLAAIGTAAITTSHGIRSGVLLTIPTSLMMSSQLQIWQSVLRLTTTQAK